MKYKCFILICKICNICLLIKFLYVKITICYKSEGNIVAKNKSLTILSVFLLIFGLFSTLFLDDVWGSRVSELITLSTAIIGAVALFFQFKRDKEINQANFVVQFWNSFSSNENLQKIMLKCDHMRLTGENTFKKEDYFYIVSYAQWLETLSSLINRNLFKFQVIDDMYNYLFFVFVNNKYVQEVELAPAQEFYKGIYKAYNNWVKYLKKNNREVLCGDTPLSATQNYDRIINEK